ncbi:MAG: PilZ domain-containing protein [Deltaproteobacteria bacterium]|nr:PilZ domain-containing protein [Deltaproteobacteria bacterium]
MNTESILVDRRLFPRLYISLYFDYAVRLHGSGESFSDRALLRDISMTGVHFLSESSPKLKPGDIADFVFKFSQSDFNPDLVNEMRAKGLVKRIDQPGKDSAQVGIVVEFLSGPVFKQADY